MAQIPDRHFTMIKKNQRAIIGPRGEEIAVVNLGINEALITLQALKIWINDPDQDDIVEEKIKDLLFRLFRKIEIISDELKEYQ